MSIRYVTGDATRPLGDGPKIIVHVCNDVGGWGRGFVLALSARWSEPEAAYGAWYVQRSANDFALGAVQFVSVGEENSEGVAGSNTDKTVVANIIGQHDIVAGPDGRPPVRYGAIETALLTVADHASRIGASVHMPRIGSGLAGGDWSTIADVVERTLGDLSVTVYDLPA